MSNANGNPISGQTINFTGLTPSTGVTNASGIACVTVSLGQAPTLLGNTYSINTSYGGNNFYLASSDSDPFTILQEDAVITYTGAYLVSTAGQNSGDATVTLAATIQDIADGYPGDISNATVTFVDRENSNAIIAADLPVVLINPADSSVGSVVYEWSVNIGNLDSETFEIGIIVNNYYARNSTSDNVVVTVSKPLNNFVTGGGFLMLESSAGTLAGDPGTKSNFSVNVKFNPSGNKPKGKVHFLVRRVEADGILHTYRIKSNKINSIAIDPQNNTATINGKCNIQDVTDPNNTISLGGNRTFQVNITDNGEPGNSDMIGLTVYGNGGGLIFSSNWSGVQTVEQTLDGGNIKIHINGGGNLVIISDDEASSSHDLGSALTIIPNPAKDWIQLEFDSEKAERFTIEIISMNGAVLYTGQYDANKGFNRHELEISQLAPGVYWTRMTTKTSLMTARFIRAE
jgi:hypothetical protein